MAVQGAITMFCYAYRPIRPRNEHDIGFTLNLDDQDLLHCAYYVEQSGVQYCTGEYTFQVDTELRLYLMRLFNYALPWLKNVPQCIRMSNSPEAEYTFGFHGMPAFRLYDLNSLMTLSFGTSRGHYSRRLYCMLEELSAVFAERGLLFYPDSFTWEENVHPLEEQNWIRQA